MTIFEKVGGQRWRSLTSEMKKQKRELALFRRPTQHLIVSGKEILSSSLPHATTELHCWICWELFSVSQESCDKEIWQRIHQTSAMPWLSWSGSTSWEGSLDWKLIYHELAANSFAKWRQKLVLPILFIWMCFNCGYHIRHGPMGPWVTLAEVTYPTRHHSVHCLVIWALAQFIHIFFLGVGSGIAGW